MLLPLPTPLPTLQLQKGTIQSPQSGAVPWEGTSHTEQWRKPCRWLRAVFPSDSLLDAHSHPDQTAPSDSHRCRKTQDPSYGPTQKILR